MSSFRLPSLIQQTGRHKYSCRSITSTPFQLRRHNRISCGILRSGGTTQTTSFQISNSTNNQRQLFSTGNGQSETKSSTATVAVNAANESKETMNSTSDDSDVRCSDPIVFPWRESAISPLPRLALNDDLSNFNSNSNSKFAIKLACSVELQVFSFWSFFVTKQWEQDIANNASWAFQMAVAGLMNRTFGIPLDAIDNTIEEGVVVTHPSDIKSAKTRDEKVLGNDNDSDNDNNDNDGDSNDGDKLESEEIESSASTAVCVQSMLEEKLISLYQPIPQLKEKDGDDHSTKQPYQITFCLKPIASRLESIFMVPSLTRDDVNNNPSLKGAYTAIDKAWKEQKSMDNMRTLSKEMVQKTAHKGSKRSIIMDVSIDCAEIFQIKDLISGKVIQGQGKGEIDTNDLDLEPEMTTHLVRFEMVTSKGIQQGQRDIGSWYIIDIDDQLSGNVWH